MIMVARPAHMSTSSSAPSGNITDRERMMAYTPTFVSRPANTAVTIDGAVG